MGERGSWAGWRRYIRASSGVHYRPPTRSPEIAQQHATARQFTRLLIEEFGGSVQPDSDRSLDGGLRRAQFRGSTDGLSDSAVSLTNNCYGKLTRPPQLVTQPQHEEREIGLERKVSYRLLCRLAPILEIPELDHLHGRCPSAAEEE